MSKPMVGCNKVMVGLGSRFPGLPRSAMLGGRLNVDRDRCVLSGAVAARFDI